MVVASTFPFCVPSTANKAVTEKKKPKTFDGDLVRNLPKSSTSLFFKHNTALGPPYQILIDTNFINFSITNKLDIFKSMMDCLLAKCVPIITDCVMAELEKLGTKYRVALRIAKDPRFQRLACTHQGTYADGPDDDDAHLGRDATPRTAQGCMAPAGESQQAH